MSDESAEEKLSKASKDRIVDSQQAQDGLDQYLVDRKAEADKNTSSEEDENTSS